MEEKKQIHVQKHHTPERSIYLSIHLSILTFDTTHLPLNMLFAMEPQGTIGLSLASIW